MCVCLERSVLKKEPVLIDGNGEYGLYEVVNALDDRCVRIVACILKKKK